MENFHSEIMEPIYEGFKVISTMDATASHRISAYEHLLMRLNDYKKEVISEIKQLNCSFSYKLKDIARLENKIHKNVKGLTPEPIQPAQEPDLSNNKFVDVLEDAVILMELRETRGDFTREAMLKERGEMLRKKRTSPVRKRLI